jgi:hypothetical protein
MNPTANPVLDELRPRFEAWWNASKATPFAADLFRRDPREAAMHFAWIALVTFGPGFRAPSPFSSDTTPAVGSSPRPGAAPAVAGRPFSAGDRARVSTQPMHCEVPK